MPRRFISEDTLTSRTLARLSSQAEALFWRLVVQADDFGRFRADADIVFSGSYLGPRSAWLQDASMVDPILAELSQSNDGKDKPLITLYTVDGRRYGVFGRGWEKSQGKARAKSSKYPPPPDVVVCLRTHTDREKFGNRSSCTQLALGLDASRTQPECKPQPNALVSVPVSVSVSALVSGESEAGSTRTQDGLRNQDGAKLAEPGLAATDQRRPSVDEVVQMAIGFWSDEWSKRFGRAAVPPDEKECQIFLEWFRDSGLSRTDLERIARGLGRENKPFRFGKHEAHRYVAEDPDEFESAPVLDGSDLPGRNEPGPPPGWKPPPGWEIGPDGHACRLPVGAPLPDGYVWGVDGQAHDSRRPAPKPAPPPKEKFVLVRDEGKLAAAKAAAAEMMRRDAETKAATGAAATAQEAPKA